MLVSHPLAGLLIRAAEQPVPVSAQALPLPLQEGHLLRGRLKGKRSAVRIMLLIMANNPPPWCVNTNLHNGGAEAPYHLRCCPLRTGEGPRQHRRGAVWGRVAKLAGLLLPQDPFCVACHPWDGSQLGPEYWRLSRWGSQRRARWGHLLLLLQVQFDFPGRIKVLQVKIKMLRYLY